MFNGRAGSSATSNIPASQAVPVSVLSSRSREAKGPSSVSAYGARSEPGSPKSRAKASGSTTRSVSPGRRSELVEDGPVVGGVETRGALHEPHAEPILGGSCHVPTLPAGRAVAQVLPGCHTAEVSAPAAAELGGIVLTGGSAVRFQGADKASIEIAGATLLEHVLGRPRRGARGGGRRRRGDHQPAGGLRARGPSGRRPGRRAARRPGRVPPAAAPGGRAGRRHAAGHRPRPCAG